MTFDQFSMLLGRKVRATYGYNGKVAIIATGKLLGFGDMGEFELLAEDGDVHHCWPLLELEQID